MNSPILSILTLKLVAMSTFWSHRKRGASNP